MESIGIISLYGLIFGMIGTTTGGFIGAFLNIKSKYGKNSILKGMNFIEGGTTIERNGQIGGHKS